MSPLRALSLFGSSGAVLATSPVASRVAPSSVLRAPRTENSAEQLPLGQKRVGSEVLSLSSEARRLSREASSNGAAEQAVAMKAATVSKLAANAQSREQGSSASPNSLSEDEIATVNKLKARDREVRIHEQAHKAVGGALAGAITLSYQRGPDGQPYAIGGAVSIDTSPVPGDPEATLRKMRQVQAAALAPADPSGPDQQIAATASANAAKALQELAKQSFSAMNKGAPPTSIGSRLSMVA